MVNDNKLLQIGQKYFSDEGYSRFEDYILSGEYSDANCMLLGAVDRFWEGGLISDSEARDLYEMIDISPERASQIRQRSWMRRNR